MCLRLSGADVGERRGHGVDVRDTGGEGGVRELGDNLLRYSRPPALIRHQEFSVEGYPVVPFFRSPAAVGCVLS